MSVRVCVRFVSCPLHFRSSRRKLVECQLIETRKNKNLLNNIVLQMTFTIFFWQRHKFWWLWIFSSLLFSPFIFRSLLRRKKPFNDRKLMNVLLWNYYSSKWYLNCEIISFGKWQRLNYCELSTVKCIKFSN